MIKAYKCLLKTNPLSTRMVTAGVVLGSSDFLYQKFIQKRTEIDYTRVKANVAIGTLVMAPFLFTWFGKIHPTLLSMFKVQQQSKSYYAISMAADALLFFPAAQFLYHFSFEQLYNNFIQHQSTSWIQKDKCQHSLSNYLKIWLPISFFYYCFIPSILRPFAANISISSWNQYVNLATSKTPKLV